MTLKSQDPGPLVPCGPRLVRSTEGPWCPEGWNSVCGSQAARCRPQGWFGSQSQILKVGPGF